MIRPAPIALAAALAVGALIAAGCGSSGSSSTGNNGDATKTAAQVLADAKAATQSASSVHVSITGLSGTVSAAALDLARGTGATGTLAFKGQPVDLVVIGDTTYFKGTVGFWTQTTGSASTAKLFAGKWLKIPSATAASSVGNIKSLTDMTTFFSGLLTPTGRITNDGATTFHGQPAIKLTSTKGDALYVAAIGQPYPLGISQATSQGAGQGTFTNWNTPVTVTAPAGAIALPQG